MNLVAMTLVPEDGASTTAMRSGTSTWPGPAGRSDDDAALDADLHHHLAVDDRAFARGAHERALIFQGHGFVAAVGRRRRQNQRRGALADIDERAFDIGLRIGDRLGRLVGFGGEEIRYAVLQRGRARGADEAGGGGAAAVWSSPAPNRSSTGAPILLLPEQPAVSSEVPSAAAATGRRWQRVRCTSSVESRAASPTHRYPLRMI